eukprot:UN02970
MRYPVQKLFSSIGLRLTSHNNVSVTGPQWTPVQDAMLLYALFRTDMSLPYLVELTAVPDDDDDNTTTKPKARAKVQQIISNTLSTLIQQSYHLESTFEMLRKMPTNVGLTSLGFDWSVLTPAQMFERILYLATILELEDIPALSAIAKQDVVKVDHFKDENSWFNPLHLKKFGYLTADILRQLDKEIKRYTTS